MRVSGGAQGAIHHLAGGSEVELLLPLDQADLQVAVESADSGEETRGVELPQHCGAVSQLEVPGVGHRLHADQVVLVKGLREHILEERLGVDIMKKVGPGT